MDTGIQEIIKLYVSEKKSLRDIATIVGKDRVTIKNILLRNNVSIRSRTDSIKNKVSLGEEIENNFDEKEIPKEKGIFLKNLSDFYKFSEDTELK